MKTNSTFNVQDSKLRRAALLWDESFLWGVMAYKALEACGLSCDLIRTEEVKAGRLREYSLLFVPGGWASNKVKVLGDDGVAEIKKFVHDGGAYVGFCGGAGFATMDGIGLLQVKRRPTKERVPSFSGRIKLKVNDHPLWEGVSECADLHSELRTPDGIIRGQAPNSELIFNAWWPSQFIVDGSISVLATYGEAMPDAFSSDVNVGDAEAFGNWEELERSYRINLNPKRLFGEPAVIEGTYGSGKVVLSLVHFDTPGDLQGAKVLRNIWRYCGCDLLTRDLIVPALTEEQRSLVPHNTVLSELDAAVNGLIDLGLRNFLWFQRNPLLLQWRRGVRGLEYCTLAVMVKELGEELRSQKTGEALERIRGLLMPFTEKAKRLLVRERFAMQNAPITYDRCEDQELQALREELFSRSKSHGGLFKELIDELDRLLYNEKTRL